MSYVRSEPLKLRLGPRRQVIDVLATGHAKVGELTGPGRPLDVSKPLAHAYVIVAVGQFQGFVRDVHDLAVERLVSASGASRSFVPLLTDAIVSGRLIDRGNPTHNNVKSDFGRIGLSPFAMTPHNPRWARPGDAAEFDTFIALRPRPRQRQGATRVAHELRRARHSQLGEGQASRAQSLRTGSRSHGVGSSEVNDGEGTLVMTTRTGLKPGDRVTVPWGLNEPRSAVVIDVWGDPPTQIRVVLEPLAEDEEPAVLLLSPSVVSSAA